MCKGQEMIWLLARDRLKHRNIHVDVQVHVPKNLVL